MVCSQTPADASARELGIAANKPATRSTPDNLTRKVVADRHLPM
jgi:hypothetical protein